MDIWKDLVFGKFYWQIINILFTQTSKEGKNEGEFGQLSEEILAKAPFALTLQSAQKHFCFVSNLILWEYSHQVCNTDKLICQYPGLNLKNKYVSILGLSNIFHSSICSAVSNATWTMESILVQSFRKINLLTPIWAPALRVFPADGKTGHSVA